MAICKFCGGVFDWGSGEDGKWVKLIPVAEHENLDRTHQDENGVLRAQHSCPGWAPAVKVVKLAKAVPATDVLPHTTFIDSDGVVLGTAPERFTLFPKRKPRRAKGES